MICECALTPVAFAWFLHRWYIRRERERRKKNIMRLLQPFFDEMRARMDAIVDAAEAREVANRAGDTRPS